MFIHKQSKLDKFITKYFRLLTYPDLHSMILHVRSHVFSVICKILYDLDSLVQTLVTTRQFYYAMGITCALMLILFHGRKTYIIIQYVRHTNQLISVKTIHKNLVYAFLCLLIKISIDTKYETYQAEISGDLALCVSLS
jgi:hypothetical protein